MSLIRNTLIATCAIAVTDQRVALAEPGAPNFSELAEVNAGDFVHQHQSVGPMHNRYATVAFSASNLVSCRIFSSHGGDCVVEGGLNRGIPNGKAGTVHELEIPTQGPVVLTPSDSIDTSGYGPGDGELFPGQKIVLDSFPDDENFPGPKAVLTDADQERFKQDPITCGATEDGSVSCVTGRGHGFVISYNGSRTW